MREAVKVIRRGEAFGDESGCDRADSDFRVDGWQAVTPVLKFLPASSLDALCLAPVRGSGGLADAFTVNEDRIPPDRIALVERHGCYMPPFFWRSSIQRTTCVR